MWIDDDILRRCDQPVAISCWVPERPVVVLGSSNKAEVEANPATCEEDGVSILKRYGGGGTVVLHSGCVIVSLGAWVRQHFQNSFYFRHLNDAVIAALAERFPRLANLDQNGLSDITHGAKKIAGTSLFRSRNYLLYQASILVDVKVELIERYLQHPSKEPNYRGGRSHRTFLEGLSDIDSAATVAACATQLSERLPACLGATLKDELIAPIEAQFPALLTRAQSGGHAPR